MNKRVRLVSFTSLLVIVAGLLTLAFSRPSETLPQADLPQKLAEFSGMAQLTPLEVETLKAGQPVSKLLNSDAEHEIAVLGIVWIDAPISKYVQAIKDIEQLERGDGFQISRRISDPPRLSDFAALKLPEVDIEDLRVCRPGDCGLKLDEKAIARIQREVDWSKPTAVNEVNEIVRQELLRYVTTYQQSGNKGFPVYRDKDEPMDVATEFASMVDGMPFLRQRAPALRQFLLEYPKAKLANSTSFFYWHKVSFGLKPVIRINHVVIVPNADHTLVASKQIYASHYFLTALELRDLIPDPARGQGFWFVNINRGRAGSLAGWKGRIIRGRVQKEALEALTKGMEATRSFLERTTR